MSAQTLASSTVQAIPTSKEGRYPSELLEQAAAEGIVLPPCDPDSDEPPLESYQHLQPLLLLLKCLDWLWRDRTDYFAAGNLTLNT